MNKKNISKILLTVVFAFSMLFSGIMLALPQNTKTVYAENVSGEKTNVGAVSATYNGDDWTIVSSNSVTISNDDIVTGLTSLTVTATCDTIATIEDYPGIQVGYEIFLDGFGEDDSYTFSDVSSSKYYKIFFDDFGTFGFHEVFYVVYDLNGGSGTAPTDTHAYDNGATNFSFASTDGITKSGHAILGWALTSDATSALSNYTINSTNANSNSAITLYAVWVNIIKNQPTALNNYTAVVNDSLASNATYQWYKQVNGGTAEAILDATGASFPSGITLEDATYYCAVSVYGATATTTPFSSIKIVFDANDGTGTAPSNQYKLDLNLGDYNAVVMVANTFTKAGFKFAGWSTTSTDTSGRTSGYSFIGSDSDSDNDGIITYYATWESLEYCKDFTVTITGLKYDATASGLSITLSDTELEVAERCILNQSFEVASKLTSGGTYYILFAVQGKTNEYYFKLKAMEDNYAGNITLTSGSLEVAKSCESYVLANTSCSQGSNSTDNTFLFICCSFDLGNSVSYNANAGEDTVTNMPTDNAKYLEDAPITISATAPKRTGYKFLGWSLTTDGKVITTATVDMDTADITFYAVWVNAYSVVFDVSSATFGSAPTDTNQYAVGDLISFDSIGFLKTNYRFIGWNTNSNATTGTPAESSYTILSTDIINDKITFYPIWEKYIKTEPTAPNYEVILCDSCSDDENINLQWYKKIDDNETAIPNATSNMLPSELQVENATYYCKVGLNIGIDIITVATSESISPRVISFRGNDSISGSVDNIYQLVDRTITLPANGFVKSGYSFVGWNTQQDGMGTSYAVGSTFTVHASDDTFYAVWKKIITEEPTSSNDYTISIDNSITDKSYQWYKLAESTTSISELTYETDFYVQDGSYNSNNGTITFSDDDDESGLLIFFYGECINFTKMKFKYDGDYDILDEVTGKLTKGGDGYYRAEIFIDDEVGICALASYHITITDISFITLTETALDGETNAQLGTTALEDTTYHCVITVGADKATTETIKPKAISFNGNESTGGTAPTTIYQLENRTITLPANGFTKTNYNFIGWNTSSTATDVLSSYKVGSSDITLYAIWEEKTSDPITNLSITSWTYGDTANAPTYTNLDDGNNVVSIEYKVKDADDSTYSTDVPELANTYTVRVSASEGTNYCSGYATADFTISPKTITIDWCDDDFTYTGKTQSITASYKDISGNKKDLKVDITQNGTNANFCNTGDYIAQVAFETDDTFATIYGCYALPNITTKAYKISKADYVMTGVFWNYTTAFTYDGTAKTVEVTGLPAGVTVANYANNSKTNAGTYTASVTFNYDTTNYNEPTLANLSWTIKAKDITFTIVDVASVTYDGQEKTTTATYTDLIDNDTLTYTLSYSDNINVGTCNVTMASATITNGTASNYNLITTDTGSIVIAKAQAVISVDTTAITKTYDGQAVTIPTATTNFGTVSCNKTSADLINAGDYVITYTVVGTNNYDGDTKTINVKINKADNAITTFIMTDWTYGDVASIPQAFAIYGTPSYTYSTSENGTYTTTKPTTAGTYYINVTVEESKNYKATSLKRTFTISKAQAVIDVDKTNIIKFYGEAITIPTATTNFGTVTCNKTASDFELANVETYTITYTVSGTSNYYGATETVRVTINKAQNSILNLTVENVYCGTKITPTATNKFGTIIYNYKLDGSDTWAVLSDTAYPKSVGTYLLRAQVIETDNYFEATLDKTFEILAKEITKQDIPVEQQPVENSKTELIEGALDTNIVIVIVKDEVENNQIVKENVKTAVAEKSEIIAKFDIHLEDQNGVKMQNIAGNRYRVTLTIPEELLNKTGYAIVCIDDDGNVTKVDSTMTNEKTIVFETDHFSTWAIVADKSASIVWMFIGIGVLELILVAFLINLLIKRKLVFVVDRHVIAIKKLRPFAKIKIPDELKAYKWYYDATLIVDFDKRRVGLKSMRIYGKSIKEEKPKATTKTRKPSTTTKTKKS